LSILLFGHRL